MNNKIERTSIDINRHLANANYSLRLYSIWAIATFIVFGLFGVYPQIKLLTKGIKTHKEMREINNSLNTKINFIKDESLRIENNPKAVKNLDKALPTDYEVQNYIVDLSFGVAEADFDLQAVRAERLLDSNQGVGITADFKGEGSIGELVKSIESLKRATQVNKVSFGSQSGEKTSTCQLDIYVLK